MFNSHPAAWNKIQEKIWSCDQCRNNKRVACNIRQQTDPPSQLVKLMLVGVAPPHAEGVEKMTVADSATNDPNDNLRTFVVTALNSPWKSLLEKGLYLIHGVKCAIVPENRHQNPRGDVIDACTPNHFVQEILLTQPSAVVVFGKAPFRALLRVPGVRSSMPRGLGLSCSVAALVEKTGKGIAINIDEWKFQFFGSRFPLQAREEAAEIVCRAARHVGILP
jgi:uracil-DNA glycosylase